MKCYYLAIVCFFLPHSIKAQNWQFFPKDSLRVYTNPTQNVGSGQDLLSGIDYRSYAQRGDTTIFNFSDFSRVDYVNNLPGGKSDKGYYYEIIGIYNGNSNFGHQAVVTANETNLIFKPISGQLSDTIKFLNTNEITTEWTAFRSNQVTLECKLLSIVEDEIDSIKNISCQVSDSNGTQLNTFIIKVSKNFGLLEVPSLYEILRFPSTVHSLREVRLIPYKEMTANSFFHLTPATEWQLKVSIIGSYSGTSGVRKWRYIYEMRDTQNYLYSHVTLTNSRDGSTSSEVHNIDTQLVINDGHTMFNPIPGKRIKDQVVNETNNYFNSCGLLVVTHNQGFPYDRMHGDTIVYLLTVGDPIDVFNYEYTQNVGLTYFNYHIHSSPGGGGGSGTETLTYLNIPNRCRFGQPSWRFSTVESNYNELEIYPNPASTFIVLPNEFKPQSVVLYNSKGKSFSVMPFNGKITVSDFPNGLYILEMRSRDDILYRKKIIIIH